MEFLNLEKCSFPSESCTSSNDSNSALEEDKDLILDTLQSHLPRKLKQLKQKLHPYSSQILPSLTQNLQKKCSSPTGTLEQ